MGIYTAQGLERHVEEVAERLPHGVFLTDRRFRRKMEMWCAARFAKGFLRVIADCKVEIEEEDEQRDHDFHLLTSGKRLPFQLAEVMDKRRRRDYEYKNYSKEELEAYYRSVPTQDAQYVADLVKERLEKKRKLYGDPAYLNVLLYVNVNATDVNWASLAGVAETEAKRFASVWLVTDNMFCCLWGGARWHGFVGWKGIESES